MSFDPIKVTKTIEDSYLSYLSTSFPLHDPKLYEQFINLLKVSGKFVKGPILEATPSFEKGASINELIMTGLLSREFKKLQSSDFKLDFNLYKHQEMALFKIIKKERNVVIATGTGSGKTESFLLPILDYLFKEKEAGCLGPGVRALLLYPMNALVNDQLARLRGILANYKDITFGRYTGETEKEYAAALDKHVKMYGSQPLDNELISRTQMWDSPPHLLLTNYAMLEYLLLRPDDSVFFDGNYANYWRFLVLDEAHTYMGAKGIETAMLIRRLKDRVARSRPGSLIYIATSATIGGGETDFPEVASYAEQLFGESFQYEITNPEKQDVIGAARLPLEQSTERWGTLSPELYIVCRDIVNDQKKSDKIAMLISTLDGKVPQYLLDKATSKGNSEGWPAFLYEILKGEQRLINLQIALQRGPILLAELVEEIMPDVPLPALPLVALVDLANKAKSKSQCQPLIPARYHVFVRAIEGAYLSLTPEFQLFLDRYETVKKKDREYPAFEISSCRQCGAIYLSGITVLGENSRYYLKQGVGRDRLEHYLLLNLGIEAGEEDEDEIVGITDITTEAASKFEKYVLCGSCGSLDKANSIAGDCCREKQLFNLLKMPDKYGKVYACPACGKRSSQGIVWRFLLGADAATSVLATALYREVKPKQVVKGVKSSDFHDPWSSIQIKVDNSDEDSVNYAQRKLLVFSDSRQDAAFFAPYLNRTYGRILRRGLILEILRKNKEAVLNDKWRVQDIVNPLQQYSEEMEIFSQYSKTEQKAEIWKWLLYELLAFDKRNSLEGLGLLGFSLVKPPRWAPPRPLLQSPWNLNPEEVWTLYQVLLDTIRQKGAIFFPGEVSPQDEFFQPRNREIYVRDKTDQEATKRGVLGWNSNSNNSRSDYLIRLSQRINPAITKDQCIELLNNIWRSLQCNDPRGPWYPYFYMENLQQLGTVYRLKNHVWELKPTQLDSNIQWYMCDKCRSLTILNIRGNCPSYRCEGTLKPCNPLELNKENHYFKLYTNLLPIRMKAEEHTAQLNSRAAAELQNQFVEGHVNILSCSTTFELGVDVGELETVFMRNMPPSTANYVQRAGRAGRRIDSTAYVLTFAQRRSHDIAHYQEPWRMVTGIIKPPYFKIENLKIVTRHLYAVALSCFWRERKSYFGSVDNFFFQNDVPGPQCFAEYLYKKPQALKDSLKRIVPENLHDILEIDNWGWIASLYHHGEAVLQKAWDEIVSDVEQLEQLRIQLFQERRNADHINRLITTLKSKNLIDYLSTRNVIPKYGFPVDVVELQLSHHGEEAKMLQLERDLRIALSEYAPSSQIVAGGKLWTSRYLKRIPRKEWESYRYSICDNCNSYYRGSRMEFGGNGNENETIKICPVCGQTIKNKGIFIIPAFGFISEKKAPGKPGEEKPERTYATRVYYSGCDKQGDSVNLELNGSKLIAIPASKGKLAIINNAGGKAFKVCFRCGYTILGNEKPPNTHQNAWGAECNGSLRNHLALGHEFETDILMITFEGHFDSRKGFWQSMLYGILEGTCEAMQIERQDLDGCLYNSIGNLDRPVLVIFDDVPGGAGHVRRLANDKTLMDVLSTTLERLKRCECGAPEGNTSCYGCLRHYRNQFCHDELNRGMVIKFLEKSLS
ncbi:MAG: DEAD/DEAH box helicase [Bacillota bacterium]